MPISGGTLLHDQARIQAIPAVIRERLAIGEPQGVVTARNKNRTAGTMVKYFFIGSPLRYCYGTGFKHLPREKQTMQYLYGTVSSVNVEKGFFY
ncbi:MAG: hypothetical protein JEZ12_25670 [Desulfobacterium sp.]|nr:hypothetical protein [Desulfobacterium sp.]